jgi:hypothetical protein
VFVYGKFGSVRSSRMRMCLVSHVRSRYLSIHLTFRKTILPVAVQEKRRLTAVLLVWRTFFLFGPRGIFPLLR